MGVKYQLWLFTLKCNYSYHSIVTAQFASQIDLCVLSMTSWPKSWQDRLELSHNLFSHFLIALFTKLTYVDTLLRKTSHKLFNF